jgi:hypothetical protein
LGSPLLKPGDHGSANSQQKNDGQNDGQPAQALGRPGLFLSALNGGPGLGLGLLQLTLAECFFFLQLLILFFTGG